MQVQCTCSVCGKTVLRWPSQIRPGTRIFCTRECRYAEDPAVGSIPTPDGTSVMIPLRTRGGIVRAYTVVDADKADWVNQWRWYQNSGGYATRQPDHRSNTVIYLHRALLGLTPEDRVDVDHRDRDRLNNRLSNIRELPKGGNAQNTPAHRDSTSSHRGVCWAKHKGQWQATGSINGKAVNLGYFDSELEAAETARVHRSIHLVYAVD